uniref:Myb/SANT-like domain-containing protein n=1 Tax=Chenopodium quinoa TaxID=63459 RepID=A0A803M7U8_CHEQI
MTLQEIVAMFLYTLAHHQKNGSIGNLFLRSGETVSQQFNLCLRAILKLHEHLLHKPIAIFDECEDERWQPFKSCLGALDGTYINVRVTSQERGKYRTRKGTIAMNVLGACAPNMEFIYVLPGWEGSAHDVRVLRNALSRPNGLRVPRGNYYLVDAGYTNCDGFLAPYRGQRYHLKEWTDKQPESAEEYFNMKHARARNVLYMMGEEGSNRGRGKNKRFWTFEEDTVLIKYLHELSIDPKWKSESGFKSGYMNKLEEMIKYVLPNCGLKADPHIESRIKHWTEKYSAMAEMLSTSGFGWDSDKKMLQVEKTVFDEWAKAHKKAKGLYGVPFPHYETLAEIYAKDKATGEVSESFVGAIDNLNVEIANQSMTIQSDEDGYIDSPTHSTHSTQPTTQSHKRPMKKEDDNTPSKKAKMKEMKGKGKTHQSKDANELVASLHNTSNTFGKIFEDINANLGTIANSWSKAEEKEQKMDDEVNKVLEEVMKLDGFEQEQLVCCCCSIVGVFLGYCSVVLPLQLVCCGSIQADAGMLFPAAIAGVLLVFLAEF